MQRMAFCKFSSILRCGPLIRWLAKNWQLEVIYVVMPSPSTIAQALRLGLAALAVDVSNSQVMDSGHHK
jgi:hypothetical protein